MTMLLTSMGMATWPPARTWERRGETSARLKAQVSADEEVHESRLQISKNASIRNLTILRSLSKALFMLVAFALPLLSSPVRLHDDNPEESKQVTAPAVKPATHLARLTAYWPEEGDSYTVRGMSSSGIRLRDGHCAVDPKVIPYGSVVKIPGIGEYVAVDTGPAVVARRAARLAGRTSRERNALVVDVYCSNRSKARVFEATAPEFADITWYP